jgi:two-component system LytT family sensor kinase
LREKGSSLYDICYLIIITALGAMTSYFDGSVNKAMLFGPYLEMFKVLSVILIFMLLSAKLPSIRQILYGKRTKRNQAVCLIIFVALGIFASRFHIYIDGAPANVRCMVVMVSGLFGGPVIGIPVGLISGAYRYTLGGVTALPCALSTVIAGIVGSLVFVWNDRKFPRTLAVIVLMFLFTGFEMLMVIVMTPSEISFPFIGRVYPVVLFASVVGIILFTMLIREEREKMQAENADVGEMADQSEEESDADDEIRQLKREISQLRDESAVSKRQIGELRDEIMRLKGED